MKSTSTLGRFFGKVGRMQTFSALRYYRNFRYLWTAGLISGVGMWMEMLVMGWLAYEVTSSPFLVAVFAAARMAPILLGPIGGVIADRVDRKKLIIFVRATYLFFSAIMAILVTTGLVEFWHLVVVGLVRGVISSPGMIAQSALVMDIVGKEHITNAIALNGVAMDVTRVVGPAVGGVLIATLGPANCFWMAAVFGVLAIGALLKVETPATTAAASGGSPWQELVEGFKYVMHSRDMLSVLLVSFVANIFVWPAFQSFMPIFAKDNLGQGPMGLGFLQTSCGLGALIGVVIVASLGNFKWKGSMYLWGTGLYAIFFGVFALSHSFPIAMVLIGIAGLVSSSFGILQSTLMLILAPEEMRGRSIGFMMLAIGVLPFASLAIGAVAEAVGVSIATAVSCALLVVAIIAIAIWMPNLRRMR